MTVEGARADAPVAGAGSMSAPRRLRLELLGQVAAVLVPAALFAVYAWNTWQGTWRDSATELNRSADAVAEYARRVLDGHALRLDRANDLLAGRDDAHIRAEEARLHQAFRRIAGQPGEGKPPISIFVFDAEARMLVSANVHPVPTRNDYSEREFNQVLRDPAAPEPHVSGVQVGRLDRRAFFALSRRRAPSGAAPPGSYEGILNVSIFVEEASAELRRMAAERDDILSLVLQDGRVLARSRLPEGDLTSLRVSPESPMALAMARGEPRALVSGRSTLDGERRLAAYRAVEGWPVYVSVARPRAAIIARWRQRAVPQAVTALASAAALLAIGAAARRRRRLAEGTAATLAAANQALERRVSDRTAALTEARQRAEEAATERAAILSQLAEGVIVADAEGRISFVNDAAARIHGTADLGASPADYAATYNLLTEQGLPYPSDELPLSRAVLRGEVVTDARWRIRQPGGTEVVAAGSARPLRDAEGRQIGAVLTLRDETARLRAELALSASEAEFRAIFDTAAAGVTEVNVRTGRYIRVNRRFCELVGRSEQDILGGGLGPDDISHPDDRPISVVAMAAAAANGRYEADKRYLRADGDVVWVRVSGAVAARDESGQPTRTVAVVQDVTERRQAERRQALLVAELNHRVKNVLATVQAIANQTLRGAGGDPARFAADFTGRLGVLARAHDLLTANAWQAAELGALARAALAPWLATEASRVVLTGLDGVRIGPRQAQALVLGLHELATNAAKHGALSRPAGQVLLGGMPAPEDRLRLTWQEKGGPAVPGVPSRKGFGTRLLERGLASDLGPDARVTLFYAAEGLLAEILFRADGQDDA